MELSRLLFHTKVVGVTFRNDDGTSRQDVIARCSQDELLSLLREPDNAYDHHAIKVCTSDGTQLGYVSQECSADLAPIIDAGKTRLSAQVTDLTGGTPSKPTRGVNVAIYEFVEGLQSTPQAKPSAAAQTWREEIPVKAANTDAGNAIREYVNKIQSAYSDGYVSVDELNECRRFAKSMLVPEMMKAAHAQVLAAVLSSVARDGIISPADEKFVAGVRKVLDALGWSP